MAYIIIDSDGKAIEGSKETPEKGGNSKRDESPREMPDLQIVEIGHIPEKNREVPPWIIRDILEIIEGGRKEIEKKLPN